MKRAFSVKKFSSQNNDKIYQKIKDENYYIATNKSEIRKFPSLLDYLALAIFRNLSQAGGFRNPINGFIKRILKNVPKFDLFTI